MYKETHVSPGASIQDAIDNVSAAGGGIVIVQPGEHIQRCAVRLRDNVRVVGESGAILTRLPSITTGLLRYIGYGHYELPLTCADGFEVGDGIHIEDDASVGFYNTVATITAKCGDTVFIDRFLNHDYNPAQNSKVTRVFSIIEAENVANASLENIVLDGNSNETFTINGCRAGGIFLLKCRNIQINKVEVRKFKGDAISFQQCVDIFIRNCNIHDNTGGGLHPGSGSVRYIMDGNNVYDNGGCGLFYCLRTTNSLCTNNRFENNGKQGISIGERDTDHIIRGNKILSNHCQGVHFRDLVCAGGDRVLLASNVIGSNCKVDGKHEIDVSDNVADIHIYGNSIIPVKASPISIGNEGPAVHIYGNTISGQPQTVSHITGNRDRLSMEISQIPPLGPEALKPQGAMHLNIPDLWPWAE